MSCNFLIFRAKAPLSTLASELSLPVSNMNAASLSSWTPDADLLITASFGYLIPTSVLDCFKPLHALNLHPSLLPRYRGAAPIQWALAKGDVETGVTLQELSREKFDRGRILKQKRLTIPTDAYYNDMEQYLGGHSGGTLVEVLKDFERYKSQAYSQDGTATRAPKATNDQSRIHWPSSNALAVYNWNRGFGHQYPLWAVLSGRRVQLFDITHRKTDENDPLSPGACRLIDDHLEMDCATGVLRIGSVKQEGGKVIAAMQFWNGASKGQNHIQFE